MYVFSSSKLAHFLNKPSVDPRLLRYMKAKMAWSLDVEVTTIPPFIMITFHTPNLVGQIKTFHLLKNHTLLYIYTNLFFFRVMSKPRFQRINLSLKVCEMAINPNPFLILINQLFIKHDQMILILKPSITILLFIKCDHSFKKIVFLVNNDQERENIYINMYF